MNIIVERNMDSFLGKPRKRGDVISGEEWGRLTYQSQQALQAAGWVSIDGMAGNVEGSGVGTHLKARVDSLEASLDALRERVTALEAQAPETPARRKKDVQ